MAEDHSLNDQGSWSISLWAGLGYSRGWGRGLERVGHDRA